MSKPSKKKPRKRTKPQGSLKRTLRGLRGRERARISRKAARQKKKEEAMAKDKPSCAFPECEAEVTEDDYCHGCQSHTCDDHSLANPWGAHQPQQHWEVCSSCNEPLTDCICFDPVDDDL